MKIVIEKNVPLPTDKKSTSFADPVSEAMFVLKPGESFIAPKKYQGRISNTQKVINKKTSGKRVYTTRTIGKSSIRVWRVK